MQVAKLRVPGVEDGLVPAGAYFRRLAEALRAHNKRTARDAHVQARRSPNAEDHANA